MTINSSKPHKRKSIRLPGYDYSFPGAYFITITTFQRQNLFGLVNQGSMVLNLAGEIVRREWKRSAEIRKEIFLDEFVVMPNHIHAIVWILESDVDRGLQSERQEEVLILDFNLPKNRLIEKLPISPTAYVEMTDTSIATGPRKKSVGALIAGFKSACTVRVNQLDQRTGRKLWQRNYYERIIRDQNELDNIRQYILENPINWDADSENMDINR